MSAVREDLLVWTADAEPYEPTCIGSNDDEGLSVTLYHEDGGAAIIGGAIYDGAELVGAFGVTPGAKAEVKGELPPPEEALA